MAGYLANLWQMFAAPQPIESILKIKICKVKISSQWGCTCCPRHRKASVQELNQRKLRRMSRARLSPQPAEPRSMPGVMRKPDAQSTMEAACPITRMAMRPTDVIGRQTGRCPEPGEPTRLHCLDRDAARTVSTTSPQVADAVLWA